MIELRPKSLCISYYIFHDIPPATIGKAVLIHVVISGVCQQDVRIFKNGKVRVYPVKRTTPTLPAWLDDGDDFVAQIDSLVTKAMALFPRPTIIDTAVDTVKRMRA